MIKSPWRDPFQVTMASKKGMRTTKRRQLVALISVALVCAVVLTTLSLVLLNRTNTYASNAAAHVPRVSTIDGLKSITMVGSTAFIVDGQGKTQAVDANPYGVAIAPASSNTPGSLRGGDIVVTNIGANDAGTTLVRFPGKMGPGRLFNTTPSAGTKGPADQAFNTLSGTDWVANLGANDIEVFRPNGTVLATIKNALFNKPWGQAFNGGLHNRLDGAVSSFFSSNAGDATIDRIDVIPGKGGVTTFRVFQIGQLTRMGDKTKIGLVWVPSLMVNGKKLADVLLALDPALNRIAAFPNSTTLNTTVAKSMNKGMTVFEGKPLNMPGGLSINPLNGDVLVVNLNDNNLVEVNLTRGRMVGVRQLDNVPVDAQTGNGSALFGVVATTDQKGNLVVYFTDDNTNTLNVLST